MATLSSSPPDLGRVNTAADAAIDHRDSLGLSALMVAAAAGDAESVRWLLGAGARIELTCKLGANACDYAHEAGLAQADSTRMLLEAGARPSALSEQVRAEITRRRLEREARSRSSITSPRAAADHTTKFNPVAAGSPSSSELIDGPSRGAFVGASVTHEGLATLSMLTSAPDHVFAGLFSPPPLQPASATTAVPPPSKDRARSARRDIPTRLVMSDQRDSASSSPTRGSPTSSEPVEPVVRGDYFSNAAAAAAPPVTPPRAQHPPPQLRLAGGSPLSHSFSASGSPLAGAPMPRPSSFQGSPVNGSPIRSGGSTPTAGSSPAKRAPAARAFISSSPWKMGGAMTKRQIVPPAKPTAVVPPPVPQQQQQTMPAQKPLPRSVEPSYESTASALARAAEQQQQRKLRLGIRDGVPATASFTDALQHTPSKLRRPSHTLSSSSLSNRSSGTLTASSSRNPSQLTDALDADAPPPARELHDLTHATTPISPATTAPGSAVEYVHPSLLSPNSLDHVLQRADSSSSAAAASEGASTPGSLSSSLSSSPATWLATHVGSIPGSGSGAGTGLAGSSPAGLTATAGLGAIHSHNLAHQRVMSKASAGPAQPSSAAAHHAMMASGVSASPPTHTHAAASAAFMVTGSLAAHHQQQQRSQSAASHRAASFSIPYSAPAAAPPSSPSPSVPLRESDVMRVRDLVEYMSQASEVSGADVSFRNAFLLTLPYFTGASSSSAPSGSPMAQGLREILDLLLAHLFRPAVAPSNPMSILPAPVAGSSALASPVPSRAAGASTPTTTAPVLTRSQSALNPGRTPSPSSASASLSPSTGFPPSAAGAAAPSLNSWRATKLRIFSALKYWIKAYPEDFLLRLPLLPPQMQGPTTPTAAATTGGSGGRRMSSVDEHESSARTIAAHVSARLQRFPPVSWPSAHTAGLAKLCALTIHQLANLPALVPQLQSPLLRTSLTLHPRLSRRRVDSSSAKGSWLLRAGLESLAQTIHVYTILRLKDVRSPRELLKTQRASPGVVGLGDDAVSSSRKQSMVAGEGGEPFGRNQMRISNNVSLWVCTELLTVGLSPAQLAALPASVSFSADAPAITADAALQSPALVAQRLALFRRFVSLAYRLLLPPFSNFNAAFEVLQALSIHAWHRLLPKAVEAFLTPAEAQALKKIMSVVASAENYKSYRNLIAGGAGATGAATGENNGSDPAQLLANFPRDWPDAASPASASASSSQSSIKIPYLGVLFKDLVSIEDGQPPLVVAPPLTAQQGEGDEDASATTGPQSSPLSPLSPSSPSASSFASAAWPSSPLSSSASSFAAAPPSRLLDTQVNFSKCRCLANMVFDALACQRVATALDGAGAGAEDEHDDGGEAEGAEQPFPLATEHELRMLMDAMSASMSETELNALSERIQPRLARVSAGGARGANPAPAPAPAIAAPVSALSHPRNSTGRSGPSSAVASVTLAVPSHSSGAASRLAGSSGSSSLSSSPTGRSSSASITFSPSSHDSSQGGSEAGSLAPSLSASLDAPMSLRNSRAAAGLSSEELAAHFSLVRRPGDASDLFSSSSSSLSLRAPFAALPSSSPDSPCSPPATLRGDLPDFQPFLHGALMFSDPGSQPQPPRREAEYSIARHPSPPIASITEETHAQASSRTASDADAPTTPMTMNQRSA